MEHRGVEDPDPGEKQGDPAPQGEIMGECDAIIPIAHLPGVGGLQEGGDPQKGGFAAAVLTQQGVGPARVEAKEHSRKTAWPL